MTRHRGIVLRLVIAGAIVGVLVWRVGIDPLADGLHRLTVTALLAAVLLGALATACCAWRWRAVSRALGIDLSLPAAAASCYRATFLNSTLPAGVIGDVHRAVDHGRAAGDVSRGVRSVTWERSAGQIVQLGVTLLVLLVLPSPARPWLPSVAVGAVIVGVTVTLIVRRRVGGGGRLGRLLSMAHDDVAVAVLSRSSLPVVVTASVVVVACHAGTFVIAARAAGVEASMSELAPVALLVLAAMAVPLSVAGWGPREGAAAWAFGAAGLGVAAGLTTAVVYGVLALVASLPGAVVLVGSRRREGSMPNSLRASEVAGG